MTLLPGAVPRKSRPALSFHPRPSRGRGHPPGSVERDKPVMDVTRAPHSSQRGFSYRFGRTGLPGPVPHPPTSANEVVPRSRAGFETTAEEEAQTYSRAVLPGGRRRRARRGPWPVVVTAASWHPWILHPQFGTSDPAGTQPARPDGVPTTSPTPRPSPAMAAPGICGKHPPGPPSSIAAACASSLGHQLTGSQTTPIHGAGPAHSKVNPDPPPLDSARNSQ